MINLLEEQRENTNARIQALYELCGNISPLIHFIRGLESQFENIKEEDSLPFEQRLIRTEENLNLYYNKDGVSKEVAESDDYNHLIVYKVQNVNELEARYFYNIELANLFIGNLAKKIVDFKYHLSKVFDGYAVSVNSPMFFT